MRRGPAPSSLLAVVAAVLLVPALGACSDDGDGPDAAPSTTPSSAPATTPSGSPASPPSPTTTDIEELVANLPQCSEVWVADQPLPSDYAGCTLPGGGIDLGAVLHCVDGAGLTAHRDRFWARLGEPVEDSGGGGTAQDPEYAAEVRACQG